MEGEENGRLPFMDVLVRREMAGFTTTIYRKPTFTGLYTRWDSYCATGQKIALIRSLTQRAKKICSAQYLDAEVENLKKIFRKNGYPEPIVRRVMQQALDHQPALTTESKKQQKVFIRLPWLGPTSAAFGNRIRRGNTWGHSNLPACLCLYNSKDAHHLRERSSPDWIFE